MSARRRSSARGKRRGYTIIEVMMAIILLVIGSAGVVAMQKAATFGNMRAKQMAVATHIAQTWMERLRADGSTWTMPSPTFATTPSNLPSTTWLNQVNNQPNVWFRPNDVPTRGSAGFDALGNDVPGPLTLTASYCTHLRLNWMYRPIGGQANVPELIRADVRVFWLREARQAPLLGQVFNSAVCDPAQNATSVGQASTLGWAQYHFVYLTSSITKNTAL